jgi:hypothetical protein
LLITFSPEIAQGPGNWNPESQTELPFAGLAKSMAAKMDRIRAATLAISIFNKR